MAFRSLEDHFIRRVSGIGVLIRTSAFALFLLAFAGLAFGQSVSGVTGIVSDSAGAIVPGATVKLTDTKTSRELTTKSDDQGVYNFSNVAPGEGYKLTVTLAGFKTLTISDVSLGVGKTETYNAMLSTGDVSAVVDVAIGSAGDTINTTDPSIGNIIDTRQLRELPIQIRSSPAALIGLQPGVVGNNVGTGSANRVGSVTGSRADQGNITVDGIDANDQATGQAFATVGNAPIDAIQEFRAVSTNPSASEGRSSGGQIQLVTKSGTNQFHGSLREYNRTAATAANSFFNNRQGRFVSTDAAVVQGRAKVGDERAPRPQLTRNQYGGSIGGPLPFFNFGENNGPAFRSGKDRLFFFFDYEARRDAQGVTYTRTVPLDHFRNGGLAYINNNPGCTSAARLNNPATANCITILTPAQVAERDPRGVGVNTALLSFINSRYPTATDFTLGDGVNTGGIRFNAPSRREDNTYTTRIDANITDRQRAFVRLNIARRVQTDVVNSVAQQFPGDPETSQILVKDYSIVGGHSWAITDRLFNSVAIGNSHSGLDFPNNFDPTFPNLFNLGALTAPYANFSTQSRVVDTPTIRDDATWNVGNHSFQFGGQWKPIKSVSGLVNDFNTVTLGLGGNTAALNPTLRPANILGGTTSSAVYDRAFALLLGRYASIATNFVYNTNGQAQAPGTGKVRDFRYNEYESYVQDNWKIRNDLTLNFGLRYQYYSPPYEANGFQAGNDVDFQQLLDTRIANGLAGIGGDAAAPLLSYTLIGKANNSRPYYDPDKNNWAPRVGFAYAPSFKDGVLGKILGDRKTSIRGGGSVVYERVGGALTFIADQVSYLFDNSATTTFGNANAATALLNDPRFTGLATLPIQNTAPTITNPLTPFTVGGSPVGNETGETNYTISQNFKVPYSYQYSLGFQRELPGDMLIDVSYVGRLGKKLFTQGDAGQIVDFKDPASGQTLLGALNAIQSGSVAVQPFFENQGALALGAPCASFGIGSCSAFIRSNFGDLISIGDASDTAQGLFASGLLRSNVGLSGQFSTNAYITNLGFSRYDGLLFSLQKKFSKGFQFDANYTLSNSKDNNSSVANTVFGGLVCDVRNLKVCYGPSDFDIRHLVNINGVLELPFGRGRKFGNGAPGWVDAIFGGFQLSGIFTARSGLPFSTTTGSFPVGFVFDSPAVLTGSIPTGAINDASNGSINFFGDPVAALAAFRNTQNGEIGQRNNLRGPSFWNVDMGLAKNFRMPWEGHRLQIRADAFNAFNHNSFGQPNANINGTTFGQITTSASAAREFQFAIRYDW